MPRPLIVPFLVTGVFLSGCKSAQQGSGATVAEQAQDALIAAQDRSESWLARHPVMRDVVTTGAVIVGVALGVALVALVIYAELHDES